MKKLLLFALTLCLSISSMSLFSIAKSSIKSCSECGDGRDDRKND